MNISIIGIDIGKTIFHLVALDATGSIVRKKHFSRTQLVQFLSNVPRCLIGMEACCGSHHLGRLLKSLGHEVRLMPAQFVRPFVKSNKNDYLDAEAIAEAVQRPTMRFVEIKTEDQLDLQALHRVRDRLVSRRTGVVNQLRAFLLERGIACQKGRNFLRRLMPALLPDAEQVLSPRMYRIVVQLWAEWQALEDQVEELDREIGTIAKQDAACQRLLEVPGVGPLVATALVSAVGNGSGFTKGRELSAWLGLVPKQQSTGGKARLLGISKRGNPYLRRLFIHGARSVIMHCRRNSRLGEWITQLELRTKRNVAVVALANKLARIAWAVLASGNEYRCRPVVSG